MKIYLLFFPLLFVSLSQVHAEGISFYDGTWKEAMEQAATEDKLIFVDAYATWCGPCKRMAKNVFTQAKVGEFFNENFINLKLDMEKTDGISFGREYPVSAYPTLFFLAPDGTVVKKVKGGQKAQQLIEHGKKAMLGYDQSGKYEAAYLEGDRSYDLVYNYVKALAQAQKPYSKVFNDYYRSEPDITSAQMGDIAFVAASETDSKAFEVMIAHKKEIVEKHGSVQWDSKISHAVAKAVDKAIEYDYPELLEEAITIAKKQMVDGGKVIEYQARMLYATMTNNSDDYVTHAKKFVKAKKYNGKEVREAIACVQNDHSTSPKALAFAADCIGKMQKYGKLELTQGLNYAKLLQMAGETKDANKIIAALKEEYEEDKRKYAMICTAEEKIAKISPVK
jgi:thiol-disulfide isomerase/thioredoxin